MLPAQPAFWGISDPVVYLILLIISKQIGNELLKINKPPPFVNTRRKFTRKIYKVNYRHGIVKYLYSFIVHDCSHEKTLHMKSKVRNVFLIQSFTTIICKTH